VRLSRREVKDHINYRKNDRWRSYRFHRALRLLKSPMRCICESFGTTRLSSFSTQTAFAICRDVRLLRQSGRTPIRSRQLSADIVAKVPKVAAANFSPKNEASDDRHSIGPQTRYENRLQVWCVAA
jgi:hypothetical protein